MRVSCVRDELCKDQETDGEGWRWSRPSVRCDLRAVMGREGGGRVEVGKGGGWGIEWRLGREEGVEWKWRTVDVGMSCGRRRYCCVPGDKRKLLDASVVLDADCC